MASSRTVPKAVLRWIRVKLTQLLLEAGLLAEAIQCITGPGTEIGDALCSDRRVRKITFTGSRDVGEHICHIAGL